MITFDEGGGYWDFGVLFSPSISFGDGPPYSAALWVSPFSRGGKGRAQFINDHASVRLSFIERQLGT